MYIGCSKQLNKCHDLLTYLLTWIRIIRRRFLLTFDGDTFGYRCFARAEPRRRLWNSLPF